LAGAGEGDPFCGFLDHLKIARKTGCPRRFPYQNSTARRSTIPATPAPTPIPAFAPVPNPPPPDVVFDALGDGGAVEIVAVLVTTGVAAEADEEGTDDDDEESDVVDEMIVVVGPLVALVDDFSLISDAANTGEPQTY
jgi:hypothetical protein